jgi:hypothetical protein
MVHQQGQWRPAMESKMTNQATDKQINYILSLIRGCHDSDAFREIAKDMRVSMTAASKRATIHDASATIDRLKKQATR